MDTINITQLPKATELLEGDTMALVRTADDGTQTAYQIGGMQFKGEDAYDVAVSQGYTGTREEWEQQCTKVADFSVTYDPDEGAIVITH